jgi:hypothetical protein
MDSDMRTLLKFAAALALLVPACRSADERDTDKARSSEGADSPAPAPRPWTQTFMSPAVLIARDVRIEGPLGIRDHVALTVDSELHEYATSTGPDGLLQTLTFKQGLLEGELRGQLDQLVIVAEQRITVLERPGDATVIVVATGEAMWQTPSGEEKRGESLRLVGEEPK